MLPRWIFQSPPRAWFCFGLVVGVLLLVAAGLVRQNLNNSLAADHRAVQRVLMLLGSLAAEALKDGQPQNLDSLLQNWAATDKGLAKRQFIGPKNAVNSNYHWALRTARVQRPSLPIRYSYHGRATLNLARDLSPVYKQNAVFRNQMISLVVIITSLLGIVWFLLLKRHEETGVLRQQNAAMDSLNTSLHASEEHLRTVIDTNPECINLMAADGRLLDINSAGLAMMEATSLTQVLGHPLLNFLVPEHRDAFQALTQTVFEGNKARLVFEIQGLKGTRHWVETHAVPMKMLSGDTVLLGVTRDISHQRRTEERLAYLAHYDALTGLPNRSLFIDRLNQSIIKAERQGQEVAVVFLDLDHFKDVNDTLGHEIGDLLLKAVSERLEGAVRRGDTLARQSGDEFTIVLPELTSADDATRVVQKIVEVFTLPFHIGGRDLFMSASLGITMFPSDTRETHALLRNADIAMYRAKAGGRNAYQFYTAEMTTKAIERMELESALRIAVKQGKFVLHYQPVVSGQGGKIVGVEALVRWQRPGHGLMPPLEFIPLAEDTGLIIALGEWVMHTACLQLRQWHLAGFPELRLAVNLSARQFRDNGLTQIVANALSTAGITPRHLEIEITESVLAQETAAALLRTVSATGVQLSIDDFGTGFSSLSYLRRFPIDALKIDQSFVRDVQSDADSAALAAAIISMAHSLDMRVVAEGVELIEQKIFMQHHGCNEMQGFFFSKPLPAEDLTRLLHRELG